MWKRTGTTLGVTVLSSPPKTRFLYVQRPGGPCLLSDNTPGSVFQRIYDFRTPQLQPAGEADHTSEPTPYRPTSPAKAERTLG